MNEERGGGFLPPEPAGPEPELGGRPAEAPTQPIPAPAPQAPAPGPPAAPPPPPTQPPPPGGWQQPPPGYQQPAWGYGQPPEPDNGSAVAGFVLSLVAGGLLLFSGGLSSIVSVGCAIAGIIYSRKGKQKVDAGETRKNRGLAQAGFIIGIVSLVLSLLATAFWVLLAALAVSDEEFQRDLENEFDETDSIRASMRLALTLARGAVHLLG
jgi:hypothetical protein